MTVLVRFTQVRAPAGHYKGRTGSDRRFPGERRISKKRSRTDKVTKKWPDCDFTRIQNAGEHFLKFGQQAEEDATNLFNEVKTGLYDQTDPDVDGILEDMKWLATAYRDAGTFSKALQPACKEVAEKSDTERKQVQAILNSLVVSLDALDVASAAPAKAGGEGIEQAQNALIRQAAADFDTLMKELDDFVANAIKSNTGIYTNATTSARLLTGIIERTPRNTDPIHNDDNSRDNNEAGQQGEDRAGVPRGPKTDIMVDGRVRTPDYIDTQNHQVTEVKNKNTLDKGDTEQIQDMTKWANQNGYSPILVADHRTKLTPEVQKMVDEGKITLIRKELDDNSGL